MIELNVVLVLLLLISTFILHGKLNRIEKMLRRSGEEKERPPLVPQPLAPQALDLPPQEAHAPRMRVTVPPPFVIPQSQVPESPGAVRHTPGMWDKFVYWFCFGIQRDDVSEEYAAATTWLIRAGILILLCAVGFFLKYSIENNLVSPTVRIIMTFVTAAGLFIAGVAGLNKRFHILAVGVLSVSVVTFYMGAFAGFKLYHILPAAPAFVIMLLTTAVAMLVAVKYNLLPVALISCAGGYLTPVMLSENSGNLTFFLGYIALISAGVLIASRVYRWRSLEVMAFVLSFVLAGSAVDKLSGKVDLFGVGCVFVNFLIFLLIPVVRKKDAGLGLLEWLLPILAAAVTLLLGVEMIFYAIRGKMEYFVAAAFAVIVSAVCLGEGIFLFKKRQGGAKLLPAFLAASIVALGVAVPLALDNSCGIVSAWSVLAFALIVTFVKSRFRTFLVLGIIAFFFAFMVMMLFDSPGHIIGGSIVIRFFRGGVFTFALLASGTFLHKNGRDGLCADMKKIFFALGGFSFLIYTSIEVYRNLAECEVLRGFRNGGLSVWWAISACALLICGIRKDIKVLRIASFLLFTACVGKIYLVDIAGLNTLHKVVAFLLTGILFLGGAAAYMIFRKRFAGKNGGEAK